MSKRRWKASRQGLGLCSAVLVLLVVGCNNARKPPTVTYSPPETATSQSPGDKGLLRNASASVSAVQTFSGVLEGTTTTRVVGLPDQVGQLPAGIRVAHLFQSGNVTTRLDFPGSAFPDGRSRIVRYDHSNPAAEVVFTDTSAPDPTFSEDKLGCVDI